MTAEEQTPADQGKSPSATGNSSEVSCSPQVAHAAQLSKFVAQLNSIKAEYTQLGNARRFVGLFGNELRYCVQNKQWLYWNGQYWARDEVKKIYAYARVVLQAMHSQAASEKNDDRRQRLAAWTLQSESAHHIEKMIELAQSEPGISVHAADLDANPMLLGIQNGVIDLRTGNFRPANREDLMAKSCPVAFVGEARCSLWEAFIDRITCGDKRLANYIQRIFGYCLTGSTKEQCLFIFCGPGANGKSVLLRILETMLGDYACTTPTETLMVRRNAGGPSPDLARLQGVRLALAFEPSEGARLSEEVVKQITGQDKIACRKLYGDIFEFDPQFKVALATNHKPIIGGVDHAIWRRIRLIPLTVIIPAEEMDRDLVDKVAAELSGVLNWALQGLSDYQREGLVPPECVLEATKAYRSEMDIIGDWIEECCVEDAGARVAVRDLYGSYQAWSKASGHYPFSKKRFAQRLRERGIKDVRTSGERLYVGLALRSFDLASISGQVVHGVFGR